MKEEEYEWNRKLVKRMMVMRGFIGTMSHLTDQFTKLMINDDDFIVRTKIAIEEYEKRKGELEE